MTLAGPVAKESSISAIATVVDQFGLIQTKQVFLDQLKIPVLAEGSFGLAIASELTRLTSNPTPDNLKQAITITDQLTQLAKELQEKHDSKTWEHVLRLDAATNGQIIAVGECGWTGPDELSGMVQVKNVGVVPFKGTGLITQVDGRNLSDFKPIEITAGHMVGTVSAEGPRGYGTFPYHNGKVIFEVEGHPIRTTEDVHLGPDGKVDAVVLIPEVEKPPPQTWWQWLRNGSPINVDVKEPWQRALVIGESKLVLKIGNRRIDGEIACLSRMPDGKLMGSITKYPSGCVFFGDEIISKIDGQKFYCLDALTQLPNGELMGLMRKPDRYEFGTNLFIGGSLYDRLGKVGLSISPHRFSISGHTMKGEASLNYEFYEFELDAMKGEIEFHSWRGHYKYSLTDNKWLELKEDEAVSA